MRVPGSGCVSPMDLDHAWSHLVGSCLREMVLDANMRPDGRGLIDLRPAQYAMHVLPVPHGSALSSVGDSQVRCWPDQPGTLSRWPVYSTPLQ